MASIDDTPTGKTPPGPERRSVRSGRVLAAIVAVIAVGVGFHWAPEAGVAPDTATGESDDSVESVGDRPGIGKELVVPDAAWDHEPAPPVDPALLDGLRFVDATEDAGLDAPHTDHQPIGTNDMAGGAAVGDFDGDGHLDLYLTRVGLPNLLYRNNGDGTFTDIAAEAGVQGEYPQFGYSGAVFVDVDGDGLLDLWVTSVGHAPNALYINQGDGTFSEEAAERGLTWPQLPGEGPGANTFSTAFADFDGDGDLDMLVLDWYTAPTAAAINGETDGVDPDTVVALGNDPCAIDALSREHGHPVADSAPNPRTRLLENDGTGHFHDVTDKLGIDPASIAGFSAIFADYDGDGWLDLFIAGDFCTSKLLRNVDGERFEDVTDTAGVGTDENGMGQAVVDIDGDGHLDWFVSAIALPESEGSCPATAGTIGCTGNRLYRNRGDGSFEDATDRYGVRDGYWGWGVVAADLTNTGRLDLAMTNGWYPEWMIDSDFHRPDSIVHRRSHLSPNRLWLNTAQTAPEEPWPDVAEQVGFVSGGNGKALLAFDSDGNGRLDLLEINTEHPPVLLRNETPSGPNRRWVRIALRDDTTPNRFGIGSRITVVTDTGDRIIRDLRAGGTFQGSGPAEVHVGLGAASIDRIEVDWPDRGGIEVFTDFEADQEVVLHRNGGD